MKDKLERISALRKEASRLEQEIKDSLGPDAKSVLRRYINAEHHANRGYGFPSDMADFSWSICCDRLLVKWDETWARGGYDNGSFTVPISMLTDGGVGIAAFESKRNAEKAEDARIEREKQVSDENYDRTVGVNPHVYTALARRLLVGKRVELTALVTQSRPSGHAGDRFLNVFPSQPKCGEEIKICVGTFRIIAEDPANACGGVAFGLEPSDGREEFWLDPRILFRLHDQTVTLFACETDEADSPRTTLAYGDITGGISNGDGTIQFLAPPGRETGKVVKVFPKAEVLERTDDGASFELRNFGQGKVGERFDVEHMQ